MSEQPVEDGTTHRLPRDIHNPVMARIILALAVALTISAWYLSKMAIENAEEERFQILTHEIETAVHDRMVGYEQVLWGGVGLFNASDEVTRADWEAYVASLDLEEHWPGIQGLGYAIPVEPAELEAHTAKIRSEGFPDYEVKPQGERDEFTSIVFLEPFDWRNQRAFGFDMWSNDLRREAMTRAREGNTAATSGIITLVQETDDDVQQGFLTYLPVYEGGVEPGTEDGRRRAFSGWVYAAFRSNDLMAGILGAGVAGIDYEIFDGQERVDDALLFDSNETFGDSNDGSLRRSASLEVQGRTWTVFYEANGEFGAGAISHLPNAIGIAGLVIDVLLFYVISSLGFMEKRASKLAASMTSELRGRSEELEEQAEQLRRSNAELEQFAYVASHDLQEPLRAISNYSAMLTKTYGQSIGEEGNRWLGYLADGSNQMSELIRELLQYSTLGSELTERTSVALNDVVSAALASVAAAIEESKAVITVAELPVVAGHADQLERVFQNLVANALKYRKADASPRISIDSVETESGWRLSVKDDGIGIKPEYHERIFELFRRVGSRSDYPGTGIGLTVCRKIAESHGGTIGVESEFGEGSEFWLSLPRQELESEVSYQPVESRQMSKV